MTIEDRDPVEQLASEYVDRIRRGEHPTLSEYTRAYPDLAEDILDLFPTIAHMEGLKQAHVGANASFSVIEPSEQMGDFRIVREIGRGGMGIVYQAEQVSLGRDVALKVLPKQYLKDGSTVARFKREAQNAARLHHTNIVPVLGTGTHDGTHFYVMQYIDGVGLDQVIDQLANSSLASDDSAGKVKDSSDKRTQIVQLLAQVDLASTTEQISNVSGSNPHGRQEKGQRRKADPLTAEQLRKLAGSKTYYRNVGRIGMQAANALDYAHQCGIYHRDIKPGNLLLDRSGVVMVTDFGLAIQASGSDRVSRTGDVVGTPRYMAPEQLRGAADERSDVYSLGLTLYELLTFQAASDRTHAVTDEEMPSESGLRRHNPKIPRDLEAIVTKAIATHPWQRYQTAGEMAQDLALFLADRPIGARRTHVVERLARWARRNPLVATLSATTLALLFVVAATTTTGYLRISNVLSSEQVQRTRAEKTMTISMDAFEKIANRLAPDMDSLGASLAGPGGDNTSPVLNDNTVEVLNEVLEFYDQFLELNRNNSRLLEEAEKAKQRIADIHFLLGDFQQAADAYKQLANASLTDTKEPATAETILAQASLWNKLGSVYLELRDIPAANEAHHKALDLLKHRLDAAASPEATFAIAKTYLFLGRAKEPSSDRPLPVGHRPGGRDNSESFQGGGRPGPPQHGHNGSGQRHVGLVPEYLQQAKQLLEQLDQNNPSSEYRYTLALCEREMSVVEGPAALRRAAEILQQLVDEHPETAHFSHELSVTWSRIEPEGRRPDEEMVELLGKAVELADSVVASNPFVTAYVVNQAHLHCKYGDVLRHFARNQPGEAAGRWQDEAERQMREGLRLQEQLVAKFPNALTYQVWTAMIQQGLASLLLERSVNPEAEELLKACATRLEGLLSNGQLQPPPYDHLAHAYALLCEYYQLTGDFVSERDAEDKWQRYERLQRENQTSG